MRASRRCVGAPSRRDAADRVHAAPLPGGDGVFKGGVNDRSSTRPASAEISLPTGSWKTILTRNTLSGPRQAEDSMPEPILFVVDNDLATLESLAAVLERRFGADYRILTDVSPASALARIEEARERGEKVALVVADLWTSGTNGPEWLVRVRELCPGAGRCVLIDFADGSGFQALRRALVLGQVDTYLFKPWGSPEERLYPVVSEIVGSWPP